MYYNLEQTVRHMYNATKLFNLSIDGVGGIESIEDILFIFILKNSPRPYP